MTKSVSQLALLNSLETKCSLRVSVSDSNNQGNLFTKSKVRMQILMVCCKSQLFPFKVSSSSIIGGRGPFFFLISILVKKDA